jgi:PAS domain S-box-containing protein
MSTYKPAEARYGELVENLERPLLNLFQATAAFTGDDFLEALTGALCDATGADMAFVSELLLSFDAAAVVAASHRGARISPFEYGLAGTPCATTVVEGTTVLPDSVTRQFPPGNHFPGISPESYVATVLHSSGEAIGLLGVVGESPMQQAEATAALLEALAPRVGAELERRQRDAALHRKESRLRRLVEHCSDVLFYFSITEGRFEYLSPAVESITGYPPEAFLANPALAQELTFEEDRPRLMAAIQGGSSELVTARVRTISGETRWLDCRIASLKDGLGQLTAICGTIRDSTRRLADQEAFRLSEQYRDALLRALPDTLFRLDAEGHLLDYVSGEAKRALPDSTTDIRGRSISEILPPSFAKALLNLTHMTLRTGKSQSSEFEISTDSQATTYEVRCVPLSKAEVLLILRDFTAIKWQEGEEERRRLRDELDVKVERRRTNPYMMTYRETAILYLVAEGQADKQIAEALGISIYTVNKHVGNILGKMAASSRTEAGVRAIREGLVG